MAVAGPARGAGSVVPPRFLRMPTWLCTVVAMAAGFAACEGDERSAPSAPAPAPADPASWSDSSPHQVSFVSVAPDVDLVVVERFPELIPSGRAEVVPGGHHWVFTSHPDRVEQLMREFLQQPEADDTMVR